MFSETLLQQGPAMIDRMKKTSEFYRSHIEDAGIRTDLLRAVENGPESFGEEMSAIMDAIVDIPDYEEENAPVHRYLHPKRIRTRDDDPRMVTYFETNYNQMNKDKARLEQLKQVYPAHVEQLTTLQQAIDGLASANPGYAAQKYLEENVSGTGEAIKHFSKTMGCGALALAGVLFTVVAVINNKKFDWKPLIALTGAALIASPGLRRMLLGGKFENEIAEVRQSINTDTLAWMTEHGIEGKTWAALVERMQDPNDEDINAAITALESGRHTYIAQEELEERARTLLPGDTAEIRTARVHLQDMMRNGRFPSFVRSMRGPKKPDAQQTVRDFITVGSAKTTRELQAAEEAAEQRKQQDDTATETFISSPPVS